jgi:integrase
MPKRKRTIYARERGGVKRWYGDFRQYADVGGRCEALTAPGEKLATADDVVAGHLYAERVRAYEEARRGKALGLPSAAPRALLCAMAAEDLAIKRESRKYADTHLDAVEARLRIALAFLCASHEGGDRPLVSVTVDDVRALIAHLRRQPNGRGGVMSDANVRHYLNALSGVFRRAQEKNAVPSGYNPVGSLREKPTGDAAEAEWLEVPDAARLLEAARTYVAPEEGTAFAYPLLATFLLTGARESEVYGLELDDVNFERRRLTIRPNKWRRVKTKGSKREVPLWPQLEAILWAYLRGPNRPTGELLFPSFATGREAMLTDIRKLLNGVSCRAGFAQPILDERGRPVKRGGWPTFSGRVVRTKMFRHTYCAARLQTTQHGAPVSVFTVSKELGHTSLDMVTRVYGHLGDIQHRGEVVEYRLDPAAPAAVRPQPGAAVTPREQHI